MTTGPAAPAAASAESPTVADPLVPHLRRFGPTVFAGMTALAGRAGAVNLGQGFPDTDGPASMLAAATDAIRGGQNQYAPGRGIQSLREAVAEHQQRRYGLSFDPDTEVLVTVGATEAVTAAIMALCQPGDEVLVLEPWFDSYPAAVAMSGATLRGVPLRPDGPDGRFRLPLAELRAAVTPQTRAILLNSPHNPTGTVLTDAELAAVADLCCERDLWAVTDEVYEHLTYDGVRHHPLATLPGMRERTVTISSAGKTFSVTGWKVGWVCAGPPLVRAVTAVKQYLTYTACGPFQTAVAHGLRHESDWVERQRDSLAARRDRLAAGLTDLGLTVLPTAGTYFLQADVSPWLDRIDPSRDRSPVAVADAVTALAWQLPTTAGVAAIPTGFFHGDPSDAGPFLRFAFCKRDEVLDDALARLRRAFG